MSGLPVGWRTMTLTQLAGPNGLLSDGDWIESKDQDPSGNIRLTQLADIGDGKFINKSRRYVNNDTARRLRCTFLEPGDVLIARMPDPLGRACILPDIGQPAITAVDVFIWRPDGSAAESQWLMYAVNSPDVRDKLQGEAGGTTRQRVAGGKLKNLAIPTPPLPEQRRIVAKLDGLTGGTARARVELERIPKLIQKYREAILVAAFKGQLTREWRSSFPTDETAQRLVAQIVEPQKSRGGREATDRVIPGLAGLSVNHPSSDVPPGWAWIRLTRIARQETGHTPSRSRPDYWDGGVPWIGIKDANIHHGRVIDQTLQTVSDLGLENSSARLLPTGTVCLSRTASVGYVTIMGRSMATSQDFATWTCTEAILPKYLMYALMAEGDDIRRFGEGSTHTTIYFPEIRALHICLAPKIEQTEIVRRIEAAFAWIDRIVAEHANASRLLPKLDQAILAKAFRGELVPQDPNDKPVELSVQPSAEGRGRRGPSTHKAVAALPQADDHSRDKRKQRRG